MGLGGATEDGSEGCRQAPGGFRRCLRPGHCPYAHAVPRAVAAPEVWGATLAELLPGDPELAWEITGLLVAEGILGADGGVGEVDPGASGAPAAG